MDLWRELLGKELRRIRLEQHRSLREVSGEAMIAMGYLSEIERGMKDPSSEVIGAVAKALDLTVVGLLNQIVYSNSWQRPSL